MKKLQVLLIVCSLAMCSCEKPPPTSNVSLTTFFKPGVSTPLDLLYFEEEENIEGEGKYYIVKLEMRTDQEGTIRIEDARTSKLVLEYFVDTQNGITQPTNSPQSSGLNDFFLENYSEWCGRTHTTRRGRWQICTGSDCSGGGMCIKHCVFVGGVCVP